MADTRFDNVKYVCWLKVCMALIFAKEGLEKLTDELAKAFHDGLKSINGNKVCGVCSKKDLKKQWRTGRWQCKTNVCGRWLEEIRAHLSSTKTSIEWDNSDILCLPTSTWDCLKLYMPFGCDTITGAAKCDIAAILSLFRNNSFFLNHIGGPASSNYLKEVKKIRNDVMHSYNLELEETKMEEYIDAIIAMLQCHTALASDETCKDAINKIQHVRSNKLEVSLHKEYELRSLNARVETAERKVDQSHSLFKGEIEELKTSIVPGIDTKYRKLYQDFQEVKTEVEHTVQFFLKFLRANGFENIDLGRLAQKATALNTLLDDFNEMKSDIIVMKTDISGMKSDITATKSDITATKSDITGMKHKITKLESGIPIENAKMSYEDRKKDLRSRLVGMYNKHCSSVPVYTLRPQKTHKLDGLYVTPKMIEMKLHEPTHQHSDVSSRSYSIPDQEESKIETLKDIFFKEGTLCNNINVTGEAGVGKSTFCVNLVNVWCKVQLTSESKSSSDIDTMKQFPLLFYIHLSGLKLDPSNDGDVFASIIEKQLGLDISVIKEVLQEGRCLIIADALDESVSGEPKRAKWNNSTLLITSRAWKIEALRYFIEGDAIDRHIQIVGIDPHSARTLADKVVSILAKDSKSKSMKSAQTFFEEINRKHLDTFLKVPVLLIQMLCLWHKGLSLGDSSSSIYGNLVHHQIMAYVIQKKGDILESSSKYNPLGCETKHCPCSKFSDIIYKVGKFAFDVLLSKRLESEAVFSHFTREMHIDTCLKIGILTQHKLSWELSDEPIKYVGFVHKTYQEYFASIYLAYEVSNIKSVLESAISNLDKMLELEKVLMFVSGLHPEKGLEMATLLLAAVKTDRRVLEYRQKAWSDHDNLISNVQNAVLAAMEECWRSNKRQLNLPLMDIVVNDKNMSSVSAFLVSRASTIASIRIKGDYSSKIPADNLFTLFNTSRLQKVALSYCTISGATVTKFIPRSLCALDLRSVQMSHADLSGLCSQLAAAENLREVKLRELKCETHGRLHDGRCVGLSLDLGGLRELRKLHIRSCGVSALVLSPHMSHLQSVYLDTVTTTAAIVRKLVDSLPRKNVLVTLYEVTIRHEVDAPSPDAILDNIRRSCTVVRDRGVARNENGDLWVEGFVFSYIQDGEFRVRRNLCKIV